VLWDVVIDKGHQGKGNGKLLLEALLKHRALAGVERVYLMTTNQAGFYKQLGFEQINSQTLMGKRIIKDL
jgi:N-acetylglutamate synthase-like GNAT family acetyltransferase